MNNNTAIAVSVFFCASLAVADEGMWTIDNFPSERVEAKYDVTIDDA